MMNNQHLIEEACFDICFATESEAFSQQESLSTLVNGVLLKEIDDAFTHCADEHQAVIRIDQLEIDLGEVPFDNYQYEMKHRLRERLREQLQQRLRSHERRGVEIAHEEIARDQAARDKVALIGQSSIDLEVIRSYLLSGRLPWNYQGKDERDIQQLFMRVVETRDDELVRLLFAFSDRDRTVDRLTDVLPSQGMIVIVRRLLGHRFDTIQLLIERLSEVHMAGNCLSKISRRNRAVCRDDIWRYLFRLLMTSGAKYSGLAEMVSDLVVLCGGDPESAVLNGIVSSPGFNVIDVDWKVDDQLNSNHSLREIWNEAGYLLESTSGATEIAGDDELSAADLTAILTSADLVGLRLISSQWHHILTTHAKLLERLLTVHGRKRVIRRRLTRELSSQQLSELIGLISPRASGFVNDAVALFNGGQLAFDHTEVATLAKKKAHSALNSEHNLWGFTFDFFFVERGSRFNKKEYCGSLLREVAAHNNCAYGELLTVMQQWLSSMAGHSPYVAELLSIINELGDLPQTEVATEHEHALCPYAECLIDAFDENLKERDETMMRNAYSKFYQRYLSDGQQLSPEAFVRVFAARLVDDAASDPQSQYASIVASLKKNRNAKRSIIQKVIDVLSDVFRRSYVNDVASGDEEILSSQATRPADSDAIYVSNAGQVLLAPYIPMLFERLGLIKQGRFIDHAAGLRAVHALQYMVDGEGAAPEYMMALNKLICGVDSVHAVTRAISLAENEKRLIDGLLTAAIENWKNIGNTSIDGLRESFLQREGRLLRKDGQWHLLVESRSYDMLLDQLPWSYATIKYAWMKDLIHVEWR